MALPKLSVLLELNSARFTKGVDLAQKRMNAFSKRLNGINRTLSKFRLPLAIGAAGFVTMGTRALNAADQIAKVADKLGVTTTELQQFRHVADLSGVSTNTLDMALQRFSRRVGEAVQGQGELRQTLEDYNIAVVDAEGNTRAISDIMGDLAEATKGAESAQEQLRIAFKAFDSEGAALVSMLRLGRDGVEKFKKSIGAGLITEEDIRAAERAKIAWKLLGTVLSGTVNSAFIKSAKLLEDLFVWLMDKIPQAIDWVAGKWEYLRGVMLSVGGGILEVMGDIEGATKLWGEAADAFAKSNEISNQTYESIRDLIDAYEEMGKTGTSALQNINEETKDLSRAQKLQLEQNKRYGEWLKQVYDEPEIKAGLLQRQLVELHKEWKRSGRTLEWYKSEMEKLGFEMDAAAEKSEELENAQRKMLESMQENTADLFYRIFTDGRKGLKAFLEDFKDWILRMVAELAAKNLMATIFRWADSRGILGDLAGVITGSKGGFRTPPIRPTGGGGLFNIPTPGGTTSSGGGFATIGAPAAVSGGMSGLLSLGGSSISYPLGTGFGTSGAGFGIGNMINSSMLVEGALAPGGLAALAPSAPAAGGLPGLSSVGMGPLVVAGAFLGLRSLGKRSAQKRIQEGLNARRRYADQYINAPAGGLFNVLGTEGGGKSYLQVGNSLAPSLFPRNPASIGGDVTTDRGYERFNELNNEFVRMGSIMQGLTMDEFGNMIAKTHELETALQAVTEVQFQATMDSIDGLGDASAGAQQAFTSLSDASKQALTLIKVEALNSAGFLSDGMLSAAELAALGIQDMGATAVDVFFEMVAVADEMREAIGQPIEIPIFYETHGDAPKVSGGGGGGYRPSGGSEHGGPKPSTGGGGGGYKPPSNMGYKAHGGVVERPSIVHFAEYGPEAAVPLPDGRTIPVTLRGGSNRDVVAKLDELIAIEGRRVAAAIERNRIALERR